MSSGVDRYKAVVVGSKTQYMCLCCNRILSSKQRIRSHISQLHKVDESVPDGQLYSKDGDSLYKCNICRRSLTSKRNVQKHLHIKHGKSPSKGVYKQYRSDPSIPVPQRTLFRHNITSFESSTDNCLNDVGSEKEISSCSETVCESGISNSFEDNDFGNNDLSTSSDTLVVDSDLDFDKDEQAEYNSVQFNVISYSDTSIVDTDLDFDKDEQAEYNSVQFNVISYSDTSIVDTDESTDSTLSCSSSEANINIENDSSSLDSHSDSDETDLDEHNSTDGDIMPDNGDTGDFTEAQLHEYCVLMYAERFKLSRDATVALKKMASILSTSIKFKYSSGDLDLKSFHYCDSCNAIFPEDSPDIYECTECHNLRYEGNQHAQLQKNRKPRCEFIITNIQLQLKHILEKPGMWELVKDVKYKAVHQQKDGVIHDIIDGSCYQNLCEDGKFLSGETHLSAVMNTDGIPLYSSSKVKLWPIFLAINEIPPLHRFARDNLIVAGMWQGKSSPPFKNYLQSFANEMNKLYNDGICICPENCTRKNVKLCVILATLDLQAKAYVANMSMHNGAYGCSACEEPGVTVKKGKGYVRSYPYRTVKPSTRNSDGVKADAQQATRTDRIKGICGVTGLNQLIDFDLVHGLVPDYMHGILLGVTKALLKLWFSKSSSGFDYYIGKRIKDVSARMKNMTPPDAIERLPRDFENNYEHFKATELQVWLLYYGLPCLKNILDSKYLEHFSLLSESTFLLLGDNITRTELNRSRELLDKFYKDFGALYGQESCGLNVHNVGMHIVDFVNSWGPLWCWSCFPFEDCNAAILQTVHGTGNVTRQYLHIKSRQNELSELSKRSINDVENKKIQQFLSSMLNLSRKCSGESYSSDCKVVGRLVKLPDDDCFNDLLHMTGSNKVSDLRKCLRVEILNQKFYSKEYSRMKKRVCNFVLSHNGEIFSVNYFVVNKESQVFGVVCEYTVAENCYIFAASGRHIIKVKKADQPKVLPITRVKDKLFYMKVENEIFISRLPNALGRCVFK